MRPDDILSLLRMQPFEPFRLYLSDGTSYDVQHPELAMVGRSTVLVGVQSQSTDQPLFDRYVNCALVHITRTEPLNGSSVR